MGRKAKNKKHVAPLHSFGVPVIVYLVTIRHKASERNVPFNRSLRKEVHKRGVLLIFSLADLYPYQFSHHPVLIKPLLHLFVNLGNIGRGRDHSSVLAK